MVTKAVLMSVVTMAGVKTTVVTARTCQSHAVSSVFQLRVYVFIGIMQDFHLMLQVLEILCVAYEP